MCKYLTFMCIEQDRRIRDGPKPCRALLGWTAESRRPYVCGGGLQILLLVNAATYSASSRILREIAVTSFLGAKRTDSATSQLRKPEIARVLPDIRAR